MTLMFCSFFSFVPFFSGRFLVPCRRGDADRDWRADGDQC